MVEALEDELKELPGMQKRRRAHYVRIMEKFTPEYMEREDVKPLIEAGADEWTVNRATLVENEISEFQVVHTKADRIHYLRAKMLGGCGNHNDCA